MVTTLQQRFGTTPSSQSECSVAPVVEFSHSSERLLGLLRQAGTDRRLLLKVVDELASEIRPLHLSTTDHTRRYGRTSAVRTAEDALRAAITLQYDSRPMSRYLPDGYLRDRLWSAVSGMERARIALHWEGMRGEQ